MCVVRGGDDAGELKDEWGWRSGKELRGVGGDDTPYGKLCFFGNCSLSLGAAKSRMGSQLQLVLAPFIPYSLPSCPAVWWFNGV